KRTALIFAPELALASVWSSVEGLLIIRCDIESTRGIDLFADIQQLPFPADSLDLLWCHHVLEMVKDDRAAIGELYRVLRPVSGNLVISSGMLGGEKTRE